MWYCMIMQWSLPSVSSKFREGRGLMCVLDNLTCACSARLGAKLLRINAWQTHTLTFIQHQHRTQRLKAHTLMYQAHVFVFKRSRTHPKSFTQLRICAWIKWGKYKNDLTPNIIKIIYIVCVCVRYEHMVFSVCVWWIDDVMCFSVRRDRVLFRHNTLAAPQNGL